MTSGATPTVGDGGSVCSGGGRRHRPLGLLAGGAATPPPRLPRRRAAPQHRLSAAALYHPSGSVGHRRGGGAPLRRRRRVKHDRLGRPCGLHRRRRRGAGAATRSKRLPKTPFTPPSQCGSRAAATPLGGRSLKCCGMTGHGGTGPRRCRRRRRAGGGGEARRAETIGAHGGCGGWQERLAWGRPVAAWGGGTG